jgi:serine/threonine protein kinase
LHRDLKPESILFSGNSWKIGAFGYCTRSRSGVVKERYNAGSPLYMAPEVLAQNLYSEKSDVWSLGLILYEMLHGRTAFQSKGELGLGREQRQQRISYQCHPNLAKILMKAIAFSHQMRPSLSELQTLIAHHISLTAGSENQISKGGIT